MQSGWNRLFGKHVKPQMDLEGAFSIPLLCLQVHLPRLPPVLKQACVWGGNPAQQTHHRGSRKGAGEGRIWGLGTSHCSENPCWARGFTEHLQSLNSGSASSPLPAVCQPLKYWDKAGEVLKQPLRWLKRTRKTSSSTSALWVQLLVGSAHFSLIKVHKVQRTEGFDQQ